MELHKGTGVREEIVEQGNAIEAWRLVIVYVLLLLTRKNECAVWRLRL